MDKTASYRARLGGPNGDVGLTSTYDRLDQAVHWLALHYTAAIGYGEVRLIEPGAIGGKLLLVLCADGIYAWQKRADVDEPAVRWMPSMDDRVRPSHVPFRQDDFHPSKLGRFDCGGRYRMPAEPARDPAIVEAERRSKHAHRELERAMRGEVRPETPAEMAQRHMREALEAFGGEGASALAGDKGRG